MFGAELSTNAANAYHAGIKGRYREDKLEDDHQLEHATYPVLRPVDGAIRTMDVPALSALNMRLRDDYVNDCQKGIDRWNRVIQNAGIQFEITLPSVAFNRKIGEFKNVAVDIGGRLVSEADWTSRRDSMLPNSQDQGFIEHLMSAPVTGIGQFAGWISPPRVGIDNRPGDFEYVKIA